MTKLLTPSQATAVFNAMRALSPIDGRICARLKGGHITVEEMSSGKIIIYDANELGSETYPSQADFVIAYELTVSAKLLALSLKQPAPPVPDGMLDRGQSNSFFHEIGVGKEFWFEGKFWRKFSDEMAISDTTKRSFFGDDVVMVVIS